MPSLLRRVARRRARAIPFAGPARAAPLAVVALAAGAVAQERVAREADDAPPPTDELPLVVVDRDDVEIASSARVRFGAERIVDDEHDGVLRITGDGAVVRFEDAPLLGGAADADPDERIGIAIVVDAENVRLVGPTIRGFRTAILAEGANGLVVEGADIADAYRPRLGSTAAGEDASDWLWPHENDADQWLERYGAAVWIADAERVRLERIRIRGSQHGIVLDAVNDATVVGCDASFLSGWGLALWRANRNLIVDNAFDFCIRGYVHDAYNRGQDSAGILMFEQCSDNIVAFNSATHGGDGVFAFSGRQALGQAPLPEGAANARGHGWYEGRGHRGNLFVGNDLSFAAAHGLELTFSFACAIAGNRFEGNAICGIWGGYSQDLLIAGNRFERNGDMPYGLERGGINIEHGRGNRIVDNDFSGNAVGVHLWWDEDEALLGLPWVRANGAASTDTVVARNRFRGDEVALELRRHGIAWWAGNGLFDVGEQVRIDEISANGLLTEDPPAPGPVIGDLLRKLQAPLFRELPGIARAVGARPELRGRDKIVMTEWGPWDHAAPLVETEWTRGDAASFRLRRALGDEDGPLELDVEADPGITWERVEDSVRIRAENQGRIRLRVTDERGRTSAVERYFLPVRWSVRSFGWSIDPRDDLASFRREAEDVRVPSAAVDGPLALDFGNAGPSEARALRGTPIADAALGLPDRFGTVARTTLSLPGGRWRVRTRSDDGIRVIVDGETVLEDWTHHAPRTADAVFDVAPPDPAVGGGTIVEIVVEHFELDGYAVLDVAIEPAD